MSENKIQSLSDIFKNKKSVKPPAHEWQDLALRVIKELSIPDNKRSAVFKTCKQFPKTAILIALNDTKELCTTGDKWKYFFKILSSKKE